MAALSPAFLQVWGAQIGGLSAFLGGFAATMLVMLLTTDSSSRAASWASVLAALAATAFVVAAISTTTLVAGSHPDAPASVARAAAHGPARIFAAICFGLGGYALTAAIGCAGWIKSRRLGQTTTAFAVIGGLLISVIVLGF